MTTIHKSNRWLVTARIAIIYKKLPIEMLILIMTTSSIKLKKKWSKNTRTKLIVIMYLLRNWKRVEALIKANSSAISTTQMS